MYMIIGGFVVLCVRETRFHVSQVILKLCKFKNNLELLILLPSLS